MRSIPWTYERRPDTGTTNVRLGIWLFLASEAMLFGSLFFAYVLLRNGAEVWPAAREWVEAWQLSVMTVVLVAASAATRRGLWWSSAAAVVFLILVTIEHSRLAERGLQPAENVALACWFVLTGLHLVHVAGGVAANLWFALSAVRLPAAHVAERLYALRLYWAFVDLVWAGILATVVL